MVQDRGNVSPGLRVKTDSCIVATSATTGSKKRHHHELQTVTSTESKLSSLSISMAPTSASSTGILYP